MANLYFSRDTKVFVELTNSTTGTSIWEIPVLDGYSFSQATNASEITLNEMAAGDGTSRRARQMFTDSYAPAEWSFSTYARPFAAAADIVSGGADDTAGVHHAVEEALWSLLAGTGVYTPPVTGTSDAALNGVTFSDSVPTEVDFSNSNKTTLGTATIYFVMGKAGAEQIYKISNCVVNEASIDFDIDGIATINWSGFGSIIQEDVSVPTADVTEATVASNNYIRNRLTSLVVSATASENIVSSYSLVLTGGNITINNNITYLTPETLGSVNQPLGHVTGTRSVSGNFTCYLSDATAAGADLFEDIITSTTTVTNDFDLHFFVGSGNNGTAGTSTPRYEFKMASCHLEVPTHSIEDVISLETTFHALPSTIDNTDELVVKYIGQTPA